MPIHPTNIIDGPPFAVKIIATMIDGQSFFGTGFQVSHQNQDWLVTCRHNIELENFDFVGSNDLRELEILGHSVLNFDEGRRVVGVRINGEIADAVAIELREGEFSRTITPGFDTAIDIWVEGESLPPSVTIRGPAPEHHQLELTPSGYVTFQGFAGEEEHPTTRKGAELDELPGCLHEWMIRFVPAVTPGFSGGPLLRLTNERLSLLGIVTHAYPGSFSASMPDGRVAFIDIPAGAAVPLAPLLTAMETAPVGHSILEVLT